ncbi:MAG: hypothetical protein JXN60_00900 [Lentisphaerae bacterium]|nr:hypothetical protein [Lentisphaerota bacterium]
MEKNNRRFLCVTANARHNNGFCDILDSCCIDYNRINPAEFERTSLAPYHGILFMPGYFEWADDNNLKERVLAKLTQFKARGGSLYAEYVQSDDYRLRKIFLFKHNGPPRSAEYERAFVSHSHFITSDFPENAILPVRNCCFLPGYSKTAQALLSFGTVLGTREVLYGTPERREMWPALLAQRTGPSWYGYVEQQSWVYASFELSRYVEKNFPLQKQWEKILRRILIYLLPESQKKVYAQRLEPWNIDIDKKNWALPGMPVTVSVPVGYKISFAVKAGRRRLSADVETTRSVKKWKFVPDREGALTMTFDRAGVQREEQLDVMSRKHKYRRVLDRLIKWYLESGVMPKKDGTEGVFEGFRSLDHKLIPVRRSDCNVDSATALYMYGIMSGDASFKRIAENILSYVLKNGFQDMNPKHATYGLWKFFDDNEDYPVSAWTNDNSSVAEDLLMFYRWTGKSQYLKRAFLVAEKFLELGMHEGRPGIGKDINAKGIKKYCRTTRKYGPDVFIPGFYAYVASETGEKKFLKAAEQTVRKLADVKPNYEPYYFRSIVMLYEATKKSCYRESMDRMLAKFKKSQLSCGAIKDFPSSKEESVRKGYGIREVWIAHRAGDPVVDQLYQNAPWAYALYLAYKATDNTEYLKVFYKLMDFLARIQIVSKDPRLDGAWMRAFDYKYWDYYGSNGDIDWGPYCIESGWSNAWIARALSMWLTDNANGPEH